MNKKAVFERLHMGSRINGEDSSATTTMTGSRSTMTFGERLSIDIQGEFGVLMKFCQKCFKEFPTEEQAVRHEARCRFKPRKAVGLIEGIHGQVSRIAMAESLREILKADAVK